MNPKISVIMSVYNTAPYLRRALDSVCNQTFRDLELICIDDGSTDESPIILEEYAARDARIRIINHGENRGVASARNSGFEAARGAVIGIVDSDDAISKNFYAELWSKYEAGGCDIVKGRLKVRNHDGRWHEWYINNDIKHNPSIFYRQWTTAIYSVNFIRKYNLQFSTEIRTGEDALFLYKLIGHNPRLIFTDKAIYYYLCNGASTSNAQKDEYYLEAHIRLAWLMKEYLSVYPRESQRRKRFEALIDFLASNLNHQYARCDWSPYFTEIKAVLADDQFYTPSKNFPFLRLVLKTKNIQELKLALKDSTKYLVTSSLRERLKGKKT